MKTDQIQHSLVAAADSIASCEISSRELTESCIARIERLQPVLNCFISPEVENALAAAEAADAARSRGDAVGPLHGVPMAHKDMYYRAGHVSTCGSKIRKKFRANHTATVIQRLADAGALHLGGLNMAEFAFGPTGHNEHWGHCRNPWNIRHITGGSSSGTGSAVAANLVYAGLGSDTGGSIRLPSAACGLTGIKPTQTRVSRYGVMGLSFSLDTVGPLTRNVRDCARVFGVIAGADPNDPTSSSVHVDDYEAATINAEVRGIRIGVPTLYYYDEVTAEVRDLMNASLKTFEELGAKIVEVEVPDHDKLSDLANVVMGSEAATLHRAWLKERPLDYSAQVRARIQPGLLYSAIDYLQALQIRPQITNRFVEKVFGNCDVLHTPVISFQIPTIAETDLGDAPDFPVSISRMTHCTRPINYLGLPAIAIPSGFTANGLPASFQLVGRPFAEEMLFRVAAAYQAATDWHLQAPEI